MQRLFFALLPDAPARARLAGLAASLRGRCGGTGWVEPSRFHLTLAFLGQWPAFPDAEAARAIEAATGLAAEPVAVRLDRLAAFAGAHPPWILAAAPSAPLRLLAADLRDRLARFGVAHDPRPFEPHLTLRRSREPLPDFPLDAIAWEATHLELLHSGDGVEGYRRLARFALVAR